MHKTNRRLLSPMKRRILPYERLLQATVCDPCSIRNSRMMRERCKLCFLNAIINLNKEICRGKKHPVGFSIPSTPTGVEWWKAAARSFQRAAALCRSAGQKRLWHRLRSPNKQAHHLFCHQQHGNENPTLTDRELRRADYGAMEPRDEEPMSTLRLLEWLLSS